MEEPGELQVNADNADDSTSSELEEEEADRCDVFLGFLDDDEPTGHGPEEEEEKKNEEEEEEESCIGGLPRWLGAVSGAETGFACSACQEPMVLVAQIYAPLDAVPEAYHRFLYVFSCPRVACWNAAAHGAGVTAVFRSQLPKDAPFAPADQQMTCSVCGQPAMKKCGKCHALRYCSSSHQTLDWKAGHKLTCGSDSSVSKSSVIKPDPRVFLPRRRIVTEPEEWNPDPEALKSMADAHASLISEPQKTLQSRLLPEPEAQAAMLQQAQKADATFLRFQTRVRDYPDQVMRYALGAKKPLWVQSEGQIVGDPPPCPRCGSQRVFEFQLMPQLLYFLNLVGSEELAVDWSSLIVYTCEKSCSIGQELAVEYLFAH